MNRIAIRNIVLISLLAWLLISMIWYGLAHAGSIFPDTLTSKQVRDVGDYYIVKVDPRVMKRTADTMFVTLDTTWAKKRVVEFTKPVKFRLTPQQTDSLAVLIRIGLMGLPESQPQSDSVLNTIVKVK